MEHLPIEVTTVRYEELESYQNGKKIGNYLLGATLGEGSFAKVKEAIHIVTGEKVAVKVINKKQASEDRYICKNLRREARILQRVRHSNIVQLLEVLETEHYYYLVMEYCAGGELLNYICVNKKLDENTTKKLVYQLVSAVLSMHTAGVVHRDLKIENFLLTEEKGLKIIDFGLSNTISEDSIEAFQKTGIFPQLLTTHCGSPAYAAPELLAQKNYGPQVDVWSIGVNMYAMLTGYLPYMTEPFNVMKMYEKMMQRNMTPIPNFLSEECRDLIMRLLEPIPEWRITLEQVLHHKWFKSLEGIPPHISLGDMMTTKKQLCKSVLSYMQQVLNIDYNETATAVFSNRATYASAVYHLLVRRLDRFLRNTSLYDKKLHIESSIKPAAETKSPIIKPFKVKKFLYQGKKITSFSKTQTTSSEKIDNKCKVDFTINSIRLSSFEKLNVLAKNFDKNEKLDSREKISVLNTEVHKTPHRRTCSLLDAAKYNDANFQNKVPMDSGTKIKDLPNVSPHMASSEWKLTKIVKKPLLAADEASCHKKFNYNKIPNNKSDLKTFNDNNIINAANCFETTNKTSNETFSPNISENILSPEKGLPTLCITPSNFDEYHTTKQPNSTETLQHFNSMNLDQLKQALKFSRKKFLEMHQENGKSVTNSIFNAENHNEKSEEFSSTPIQCQFQAPAAATVNKLSRDFNADCVVQEEYLSRITADENNNILNSLRNSNQYNDVVIDKTNAPSLNEIKNHVSSLTDDQTPKIVKIAPNKKTLELKVKQFAQFKSENNSDSDHVKMSTNSFQLKPLEFNLNFRNKKKSYNQKKQTSSLVDIVPTDDLVNKTLDEGWNIEHNENLGGTTEDAKTSAEQLSLSGSYEMDVKSTLPLCNPSTDGGGNVLNKTGARTLTIQKTSIKISIKNQNREVTKSLEPANNNKEANDPTNPYDSGFFGASSTEDGINNSPTDSINKKDLNKTDDLQSHKIFSKVQTKEKDFFRPTYTQTPTLNRKVEFGIVKNNGMHKTWGSMEWNNNESGILSQNPTFQRANSKIMDNKNKQFAQEIRRNNWSYASLPHSRTRSSSISKEHNIEAHLHNNKFYNPPFFGQVPSSPRQPSANTEPGLCSRSSKTFNLARALESAALRRRGAKSSLDHY